jgi:hypothetical protein
MTVGTERRKRTRNRLVLALVLVLLLLAALLAPPWISIGRYKARITQLMSTALGRPVRLSSVELRLLPRPGFVITDLTVEEDPAYGAEPVLHANTVVASIRLLSLWRGRLEVSRVSVDEASLNLERNDSGQWNFDPLFRAATTTSDGAQSGAPPFPYLEATDSRINLKKGIEKLPYSLVNADVSFWQESGGDWRIRLRGQPARTDVSLDLADTGIVRLEARLRRAPDRNQMPIHLDIDWREAQLGQLSRLILGADPGWRAALTGEMQLDGTAENAQVKARLTATGVHRAEFAPSEPLDFDANCSFGYRYLARSVEKLVCNSPLGDGHFTVTGDLPGDKPAKLALELQQIPVSAGLDALRTLRSGFNSDLDARGTVSGKIAYDPEAAAAKIEQPVSPRSAKKRRTRAPASVETSALSGSLIAEGFRLSGGGLSQPIQAPKFSIEPDPEQARALVANLSVPAGAPTPLAMAVHLTSDGYKATIRGPALLPRIRELARLAGVADEFALQDLAGDPATLDLSAEGPWLTAPRVELPRANALPSLDSALAAADANADRLAGVLTLHNANWKSDALANRVSIAQAVLHLGGETAVWDPIEFTDGPVKGTATFQPAPPTCAPNEECLPQLDLRFGELDAADLQAALLGAQQKTSVFSELIARFSTSSASVGPAWPSINGTVKAASITMGPATIRNASVALRIQTDGVEFTSLGGDLLGGKLQGSGKLTKTDKPHYVFVGTLAKASPALVCRMFSLRCSGGPIDGNGKVELSGFTDKDLAASAKGAVHFEWRRGGIEESPESAEVPKNLSRFDRWTADAVVANNAAAITSSTVQQGMRKDAVDATVTFGDPATISFAEDSPSKR